MHKFAVIFPGQGAQYVGMGQDVYEQDPQARELYEQASQIVGFDVAKISFEGPAEELSRTDRSQVAILVHSWVMLTLYRRNHNLDQAQATCGLSLGEYTALLFAEVLTFEDALRLVTKRGTLMQQACDAVPSGMSSVIGMSREQVGRLITQIDDPGPLSIANINSPNQVAISGTLSALAKAKELLESQGAKRVLPLKVAGAFHSALMKPAQEQLAAAITRTPMSPPRIPVIANVSATYLTDVAAIRQALVEQLSSPVLWQDSMEQAIAQGVTQFYEIGPGKVLTGLLKRINRQVSCKSIGRLEDLGG